MQKKSIYASVGLHVAILMVAMISLPWLKKDFEIPQPISVELVDIDKVTQTTKLAPAQKPPEKKPEPVKEDKKPPPAPKNTEQQAVTPPKQEPDKEEDEKEDKKQLVDKDAPPDKKKKEDKKKQTTEKKPKKDFSSVLKNLADKQKPKQAEKTPDEKPEPKAAAAEGQHAPLGSKLTMSEEDALRHQLEGCWNVPIGAKDIENMAVEIFMVINRDRTLQTARVVDVIRYNNDSFFRAAADSAIRAVRNPNCSPFEVPADKYDTWKETTVTFRPSDMF
jgi:hypothetical protein